MYQYSATEVLAGIQAMIIYTIMGSIDFGLEHFIENRDMIQLMMVCSNTLYMQGLAHNLEDNE